VREVIVISITAGDCRWRITFLKIRQEDAMRKDLIVVAVATLALIGGATKAAYFSGHTVQTEAATTLEPLTMHYGTMPTQNITDRTFVFDQ
jgi:hypothetical protein